MWDCWREDNLQQIAHLSDRNHSSIAGILAGEHRFGGSSDFATVLKVCGILDFTETPTQPRGARHAIDDH